MLVPFVGQYETVEAKLARIVLDDGAIENQLKDMRNEFKTVLEPDKARREAKMAKKVNLVTKIAGRLFCLGLLCSGLRVLLFSRSCSARKTMGGTTRKGAQAVKRNLGEGSMQVHGNTMYCISC